MRTVPLTEDAKCGPCPMRGVYLVCAGQMEPELCGSDAAALDTPSALYTATFLAETVEVPAEEAMPGEAGPPEENTPEADPPRAGPPGSPPGSPGASNSHPSPPMPEGHCGPCRKAKPRVNLDAGIRITRAAQAKRAAEAKAAGSAPNPPGNPRPPDAEGP